MKPTFSLGDELQKEAAHRPEGTIKAEDVFKALDAAGIKSDGTPRQFLGTTVEAAYCAGIRTHEGVGVAVCEYPDAAAAAKGKDIAETKFAAVKGRTIVIQKSTSLTVTVPEGLPAGA